MRCTNVVTLSVWGFIFAGLLFCFNFYHFTSWYASLYAKSAIHEILAFLSLQYDGMIDKQLILNVIAENPIIGFFIGYADLEDIDWTRPIAGIAEVLDRELWYYGLHRFLWITLMSGIAFAGMWLTGDTVVRKKYDSSSDCGINDYDF